MELITENSPTSGWDIGDIRFTNTQFNLPEWIKCENASNIPQDSEYVRTSTIFDGYLNTGDIFTTSTYNSTILCITHIQNTQYILVRSTVSSNTRYNNIFLYRVKLGYITTNITMDDLEQVGQYSEYGNYTPYLSDVKTCQDILYITIGYNDYKRMLYINNSMPEWKYCGNNMYISQLLGPIKIDTTFYVAYTTSNNDIHLVSSDNMETFYTNGTNTTIGSGLIYDMIMSDTKIVILYSSNHCIIYDTSTNTFSSQELSGVVLGNYTYSLYQFISAPSGKLYAYGKYGDRTTMSGIFRLQFNPNTNTFNIISAVSLNNVYSLEGFACTSGYIDHIYYPEMIYLLCTHGTDYNTPIYGHRIVDAEDNKLVNIYTELEDAYGTQNYSRMLDNIGENIFYSNGNHVSIKYIKNHAISGLSGGIKYYYIKIN